MKTMSRFALTALFCCLSLAVVDSVIAGQQVIRSPRAPKNPRYRLDWCDPLSKNCGQATADAFCQQKRFDKAIAFQIDEKIGQTMTLSGQMCTSPPFNRCDGFKFITCVKR